MAVSRAAWRSGDGRKVGVFSETARGAELGAVPWRRWAGRAHVPAMRTSSGASGQQYSKRRWFAACVERVESVRRTAGRSLGTATACRATRLTRVLERLIVRLRHVVPSPLVDVYSGDNHAQQHEERHAQHRQMDWLPSVQVPPRRRRLLGRPRRRLRLLRLHRGGARCFDA